MIEPPVATSKAEAGRSHGKPDEAPPLPQPPLLRPIATSRAHWGSGSEFMLACVGYAVGLGNVWRFPYLCYDNGGAAFLVPYFVVLLLLGLPLTILEMGMGQRFRRGPDALWRKVHPALGGLGSGGVLAGFVIGLYYNVIIGWALYYLCHSIAAPLPWAPEAEGASHFFEVTTTHSSDGEGRAAGLEDTGPLVKPQVACLAASWCLVFLCVWKGVLSSGKVVWFTALFPYAVLLVFLARGLSLPGAVDGLRYFFEPDWSHLRSATVWVAAANQIFFSLALGFGGMLTFASYNGARHNYLREAVLVPLINGATSMLAGVVVFSILGFMAHEAGVAVSDVAVGGPGLVFVVFPEAIALMPGSQFFAVLFFVMVLCLGIDSAFGIAETSLTAIHDAKLLRCVSKESIAALYCVVCFGLGLIFCTPAGVSWLNLIDSYASIVTLFLVAALEAVGVVWVYGADRFIDDTREMTGYELPRALLYYCGLVVPVLLGGLLVTAVLTSLDVDAKGMPAWAKALGWGIALSSSLPALAIGSRWLLRWAMGWTSNAAVHARSVPVLAPAARPSPSASPYAYSLQEARKSVLAARAIDF